MARTEARIRTTVWRDPDFTSLPLDAQGLYWMLLSQPDISLAGVVPWNPVRWGHLAASDHTDALSALREGRFVIVDEVTGEVLVRTFAKHDGVLRSPKTRAGMWSAFGNVLSPNLRTEFVRQLDAELVDEAVAEGWVERDEIDRADAPSDAPSEALETPSDAPADTPSEVPQEAVPDTPSGTASPRARADSDSDSDSDSDKGGSSRKRSDRATRLPEGWTPRPEPELVAEIGGDARAARELSRFRDYWTAQGGQRGRKLDWQATWRNWLRKAAEDGRGRKTSSPPERGADYASGWGGKVRTGA